MRTWRMVCAAWILTAVLAGTADAATCVTQGEMQPADRDALAAVSNRLAMDVVAQDENALHEALLPAEAGDWDGIRSAAELAAPLVKGGQAELRSIYLLDASTATAVADTQFFCSNATGSLTVTMNMRSLPPGRYAVALADAAGAPLAGQMGLVLAWDAAASPKAWKLAGLAVRPGMLGGHDGVWYWQRARELAKGEQPWAAWYNYELARMLLIPVDFLSSPNLDKLNQEQGLIRNGPADAFPYTIHDGDRTWKVDAVRADTSLREADLGVSYESNGVTDVAALRTEAVAVLSALLKVQPGLKDNFHGLWAFASHDGKITPVIELPMAKIP